MVIEKVDGETFIHRQSILSGKMNKMKIDVTMTQISNWENGALIQNAMPNISPQEREFILSGMSIEEQNEFYGAPSE